MIEIRAFIVASLMVGCTTIGEPWYVEQDTDIEADLSTTVEAVDFGQQVLPLLVAHGCVNLGCHSGDFPAAGLDLGTFESIMMGGTKGPAVVPCKPDVSPLITALAVNMPLGGTPLPEQDISVLRQWIAEGANETFSANACAPSFDPTIKDLFDRHACTNGGCHIGATPAAGLSLATLDDVVAGGISGPALVPCRSDESLLIIKLGPESPGLRMPIGAPTVSDTDVALLRAWIDGGAELVASCDDSPCLPSCEGRVCGDDGCGASCGECPADNECSNEGLCIPLSK